MPYFYRLIAVCAALLNASPCGAIQPATFIQEAENPFDNDGDNLPDLGYAPVQRSDALENRLATMAKAFGEASMKKSDLDTSDRARQFAFTHLRDVLASHITSGAKSLLSPLGKADVALQMDQEGNFNGSRGSLFTPLLDNEKVLTWSQVGVSQRTQGLVGNIGLGQRWVAGDWLLGYNTFYDSTLRDNLQRAGFGAEAWGEYLRLSANYYQPLNDWQLSEYTQERRSARGYDVTALAWLPFYRHIQTSLSLEQYFGDSVDLFNNGAGARDPMAVKLGVNYTPVPLLTFTAMHKQGENGDTQDNLGLKFNYRFGVPLSKQLSADEVAAASSLRGSRYDAVTRSATPVVSLRKTKTLSVYLATPPWQLNSGETVALKIQVRSRFGIRQISWEGDTQTLSLTAPAKTNNPDGWTVIMPV